MSDETTPRPWRVEMYGDDVDGIYGSGDGNRRIVETDAGYYPPRLPDAALIVRAVNAHDALVDALTHLLDFVRAHPRGGPMTSAVHAAEAALALADHATSSGSHTASTP